jgi:hypothetical protein
MTTNPDTATTPADHHPTAVPADLLFSGPSNYFDLKK